MKLSMNRVEERVPYYSELMAELIGKHAGNHSLCLCLGIWNMGRALLDLSYQVVVRITEIVYMKLFRCSQALYDC